jgi:hypothetical protein
VIATVSAPLEAEAADQSFQRTSELTEVASVPAPPIFALAAEMVISGMARRPRGHVEACPIPGRLPERARAAVAGAGGAALDGSGHGRGPPGVGPVVSVTSVTPQLGDYRDYRSYRCLGVVGSGLQGGEMVLQLGVAELVSRADHSQQPEPVGVIEERHQPPREAAA